MKFSLLFFSVILFFAPSLNAQSDKDYQLIFTHLQKELLKGKKTALRDLGALLDEDKIVEIQVNQRYFNNRVGSLALQIIRENSFFEEINFSENLNTNTFMQFFYAHESRLFYSEIASIFLSKALESYLLVYQLKAYHPDYSENKGFLFQYYRNEIEKHIQSENFEAIPTEIENIASLKTSESYRFLLECSKGRHWNTAKNTAEKEIWESIYFAFRHYANLESLQIVLKAVRESHAGRGRLISPEKALIALSYLSNFNPVALSGTYDSLLQKYEAFMTENPSLEKMRQKGYDLIFEFSTHFFKDSVDYYGKILNLSADLYWIKINALQDLLRSQNPKSLLYLAAQIFRSRSQADYFFYEDLALPQKMKELCQCEVLVKDENRNWVSDYKDDISKFNYFLYWFHHYRDYVWDAQKAAFINQKEKIIADNPFESLFEQLYSPKESEATQAFKTLCLNNPKELATQISPRQLKQLLVQWHLPYFPYQSILQLAELNDYCRKNGFALLPSSDLEKKLNQLKNKMPEMERYQLENRLVAELNIEKITAVEFYGILFQNSAWYFNPSMGRIIDKFYARNWSKISTDTRQLKLFLKKSKCFENLGLKGLCGNYLKKLKRANPESLQKINEIALAEKSYPPENRDKAILLQTNLLLKEATLILEKDLTNFIQNPDKKSFEGVKNTSLAHPQDFQKIAKKIKEIRDTEKIRLLFQYLEAQLSPAAVPALCFLLNDERAIDKQKAGEKIRFITVSDKAVDLLEKIYLFSFSDNKDFEKIKPQNIYIFKKTKEQWKDLWAKDSLNHTNWKKHFFDLNLIKLNQESSFSVNLLNNLLASPYFEKEIHLDWLIKNAYKVSLQSDLQYLRFKNPVSLEQLLLLENQFNDVQTFANLLRSLQDGNSRGIADLLYRKIRKFTPNAESGKSFLRLFYQSELRYWLAESQNQTLAEAINLSVKLYISELYPDEPDYLLAKRMEFFLKNLALSFSQKMAATFVLKDEEIQSEVLEDLIIFSHYENLDELLENYPLFEKLKKRNWLQGNIRRYVREDLGLLLFEFTDTEISRFLNDYRNLTEKEIYSRQIRLFNPEIWEGDDSLSFEQIYEVLSFDLAENFVSLERAERADNVYPLIRFLELHFGTRLGFPKNLLHSNSFVFSQNLRKRSEAWKSYLETNKYVKKPENSVNSFNDL